MRQLRSIYNKAVKANLTEQTFPFDNVYTGIDKTKKRAVDISVITKLIALDLDGTLTDKNKNILEETKQELIKLAQKGVIIVLASGRPTAGIFKEAKELTLDQVGGYLLSFNGARVLDYKTNEVVYEQTLSSEILHNYCL